VNGSFLFQGRYYNYFNHDYNLAWNNERSVEIPIFWEIVSANQGKRILEFGNVLSHYFEVNHDILDKYEMAPGVMNQDVLGFRPLTLYDLIISISTLEHVGWDEEVLYSGQGGSGQSSQDPDASLAAVDILQRCLANGGKMIVSIPVGSNPYLDQFLAEGRLRFDECLAMRRISAANEWVEAEWTEVLGASYNFPYPNANAIIIGSIIRNSG
jgi:hypothetical protein